MVPGRRVGADLQVLHRRAAGGQHGQGVGLGVEGVDRPGPGPVARAEGPGAQARGDLVLALGRVVAVLAADLEERGVAQALVGGARGGDGEVGQDRGPHDVQVGADRVEQAQAVRHLGEEPGQGRGHEGEGHGLVQAAPGQGVAGEGLAPLCQGQDALGEHRLASQRHRGDLVVAVDPQDLFHQAGLALDVGAPGGHLDLQRGLAAGLDGEAEALQDLALTLGWQREAAEAGAALGPQGDLAPPVRDLAGGDDVARLAAAERQDQARRDLGAPAGRFRVEPALEAVAGVGEDAELAAGGGGAHRIEERDLQEDLGGLLGAARKLAAHDAADALQPGLVGDHRHLGVHDVGLVVEGQDLLAGAGQAHGQVALELGGVEDVQRPAQVVGHEVGDVDQRRDRPEPDRQQAILQPLGRGPVLHPAEAAPGDEGAGPGGLLGEVAQPLDRAVEAAGDLGEVVGLEGPEPRRRQVPRHPAHAQAVAPVGGDRDVDDRVVEAHDRREGRAQGCVLGQLDDALVLVREAHLALGDQHAVGLDAADRALLEVDAGARDVSAGRGEDALHAGPGVGRAADHLDLAVVLRLHDADPEPVGVRMGPGLLDVGDGEGRQRLAAVLHALKLEADHRQLVGDLLQRGLGLQVGLQPGQGELHDRAPVEGSNAFGVPPSLSLPLAGGRGRCGVVSAPSPPP